MTRQIRVRSVARKPIDEHKLAMAYVLLAQILVAESKSKADAKDENESDQPMPTKGDG